MATSQELKTDSGFYQHEPNVHEVGIEYMSEQYHEVGEQVRAEQHYKEVRAHAQELGGDPELVTALSDSETTKAVKDAVADIKRQRELAEEMGPAKLPQSHHSSHN